MSLSRRWKTVGFQFNPPMSELLRTDNVKSSVQTSLDSHLLDEMKSKTVGGGEIKGEMGLRKKAAIKKKRKRNYQRIKDYRKKKSIKIQLTNS